MNIFNEAISILLFLVSFGRGVDALAVLRAMLSKCSGILRIIWQHFVKAGGVSVCFVLFLGTILLRGPSMYFKPLRSGVLLFRLLRKSCWFVCVRARTVFVLCSSFYWAGFCGFH